MTDLRNNAEGFMSQKVMGDSGPPMRVLIWVAVAIVTVMAGTFSPGAGLAFIALGLLAIVILEFMVWQQENEKGNSGPGSGAV